MRKDLVSKIAADMAGLPKSRAEALDRGFAHYYTGKPCRHGHLAIRFVSKGICMECNSIRNLKALDAKKEKLKPCPALLKLDDALADKALARELKEVWDE